MTFVIGTISWKNDKGSSAIELALVMPILVMLIFGIFQFGLAFNNYLAITHAAREGARLAAVGAYSEATVRQDAIPAVPDSVTLSYPNGQQQGNPVKVTINENFLLEIPFFGTQTIPLSSSGTMRQEVP